MRVANYVSKFIADLGVDALFTIPGGGCIFLSDSFEREERINVIGCHHEQSCAISAEGYARLKNNIGVCLVTSGPGGTNALTGTLCSYQDSVPVIFISGNVNKNLTTNYTNLDMRQLGDQEFNITSVVSKFTKYAVQVNDENKIKYVLQRAVYEAKNGRPGPV
jgi:acetolactate synthase I/II/III large subunit